MYGLIWRLLGGTFRFDLVIVPELILFLVSVVVAVKVNETQNIPRSCSIIRVLLVNLSPATTQLDWDSHTSHLYAKLSCLVGLAVLQLDRPNNTRPLSTGVITPPMK